MPSTRKFFASLMLLASLAFTPAHAETFHTCGTIIASVPTVISSQGLYCLSHDVATGVTTGNAISIVANNVTIDCNGFKIGGLAGGTSSSTVGIFADGSRQNIVVRNCGIRGFYYGINLQGSGNLVEDNRLDNNLYTAIQVLGDNNRIQRNRVYDTGGYPGNNFSYGIYANADVIDNTVAGVFSTATDANSLGIVMNLDGTEARGNQVRELAVAGTGIAQGIDALVGGVTLDRNRISATASTPGYGISGDGTSDTFCTGNTVHKFAVAIQLCQDAGGNASN